MAEIKGIFITMVGSLMRLYKDKMEEADDALFQDTGKHWNELDPAAWVDMKCYNAFLEAYSNASITGDKAWITLGKIIYPTIWKTFGKPENMKTPLDYFENEAKGFAENLRGVDIEPRKFVKKEEGEVIVQMDGNKRNCMVSVGVFQSLMEMSGVENWTVEQKKCMKKGDETCEIYINW